MPETDVAPDPRELLARFRASYRDYVVIRRAGRLPEGVEVKTLEEQPLEELELPGSLRRQVDELRDEDPEARYVLVKHLRVVDGTPELVVDDGSELPPDEELVTLSETVTLNTAERVRVVTDIYVARRV